jgi:hypothetical protein
MRAVHPVAVLVVAEAEVVVAAAGLPMSVRQAIHRAARHPPARPSPPPLA